MQYTEKFQPDPARGILQDIPLPPKEIRWGGPRFRDDDLYVRSSISNAIQLEKLCHVTPESAILDIGCGQGRLLIGLLHYFGTLGRYVGVDVHKSSITWAQENLVPRYAFSEFILRDFYNARYNPQGTLKEITLETITETFDCVTLYSVFSHMWFADIEQYLRALRPLVKDTGYVFLTAFVEMHVPPETENPENYHREWIGSLHCIRLNRFHFEELASQCGFIISQFQYRHTNDGQSSYILKPDTEKPFEAVVVLEN
jgi:SAM-dependent methyltransferase